MSTLDKVREIIRAEVARANPIEDARGPLELIVESSVRYAEEGGRVSVTVVDEAGEAQPDRTIADVIADFRRQHPTLFKADPAPVPAASADAPKNGSDSAASSAASRAGAPDAAPVRQARDWLIVEKTPEAPAEQGQAGLPARRETTPRPAEPPRAARASLERTAERLRSGLRFGPQAIAARLARVGQALRASVSMARATVQDFGDQPSHQAALATASGPRAPRVDTARASAGQRLPGLSGTAPLLRLRHVIVAGVGALALALGGVLLANLVSSWISPDPQSTTVASVPPPSSTTPAARRPTSRQGAEPVDTGSVSARPPAAAQAPAPLPAGGLRGVPEVIDTATLSIGGKVAPLFGVQWTRGAGEPADLAGYLRGREVTCVPAEGSAKAFRCEVEGQDLSKVVLFNGGGKATSEATPDLLAAEAHARSAKAGLWAKAN
jgi:hypothetical protein